MDDKTHSFIVRIWSAGDRRGKPEAWRGSIDYVGWDDEGKEHPRLYFYDLESIALYIREQVGVSFRSPLPGPSSVFSRFTSKARSIWLKIRHKR